MEKIIDKIILRLEWIKDIWQNSGRKNQGGTDQRRKKTSFRRKDEIKRRLRGILLILVTVPVVKILEGDATIALLTIPLGLYMIFGKSMSEFY